MKFSARTRIDAPLNACFEALADFDHAMLRARRAGVDVERTDGMTTPGPGMSWRIEGPFRGRTRRAEVELVDYAAPEMLQFHLVSPSIEADIDVTLEADGGRRTTMHTRMKVVPRSLAARLALQSARLAKPRLNRRFRKALAAIARDVERRIAEN